MTYIDPVERVRHPEVVLTTDYLNNPIEFSASIDFYPDEIPPQAVEAIPQYSRDLAQFVIVPTQVTGSVYSVVTKSPVYDRDMVGRTVSHTFTEF